ncbi:MAG: ABC transporter permease subunit, partial [Phycisphaerae bacterium]
MGILRDIGLWLWRLLPANPIMVRVVSAGGKRTRHLWARVVYLVALFIVMLVVGSQVLKLGGPAKSLADLAKQSTQTFMYVSLVQLFLMSFIAPVFTAGAITQEKDANTFHILLTTPLTNGQIVLGSLFSRIYFIWVLLLAGLPIFCITMLYGGVTTTEVFQSVALAACTGLVTGALAIMISVVKLGPDAELKLQALKPAAASGGLFEGLLDVVKGAFRFTTTLLSRSHRRSLDVRIANVTAGIRGTDVWGKAAADKDIVCLIEGEVTVTRGDDPVITMSDPLTFYVAPRGRPPLPVGPVDPEQLQRWAQETDIEENGPAL